MRVLMDNRCIKGEFIFGFWMHTRYRGEGVAASRLFIVWPMENESKILGLVFHVNFLSNRNTLPVCLENGNDYGLNYLCILDGS